MPPRPRSGRGATINAQLITVQFHSPAPGVIGVKLVHYAGVRDRGPAFELYKQEGDHTVIEENDQEAVLRGGNLSVVIKKGPEWSVHFYRGEERITGGEPNPLRISWKMADRPTCAKSWILA